MVEQRQFRRLSPALLRATFEPPGGGPRTEATVWDASLSGMFVETPAPLDTGAEVALDLVTPTGSVTVEAYVLWTRESAGTEFEPAGMAVAFSGLQSDAQALLSRALLGAMQERTALGGGSKPPATTSAARRLRHATQIGIAPPANLPPGSTGAKPRIVVSETSLPEVPAAASPKPHLVISDASLPEVAAAGLDAHSPESSSIPTRKVIDVSSMNLEAAEEPLVSKPLSPPTRPETPASRLPSATPAGGVATTLASAPVVGPSSSAVPAAPAFDTGARASSPGMAATEFAPSAPAFPASASPTSPTAPRESSPRISEPFPAPKRRGVIVALLVLSVVVGVVAIAFAFRRHLGANTPAASASVMTASSIAPSSVSSPPAESSVPPPALPVEDASAKLDAGPIHDGGVRDGGARDGGARDGGARDGGAGKGRRPKHGRPKAK